MAAELKKMGLDPSDYGMGGGGSTYADPELAELDREMRRRGKSSKIYQYNTYLCYRGRWWS